MRSAFIAIASAQNTNEEAAFLKEFFIDELGSPNVDVLVDPIGPIKMKSRTEWLTGTQAGPNYRGVRAAGIQPTGRSAEDLMTNGADGIEVLYILDPSFSERAADPRSSPLRKAKFLVGQPGGSSAGAEADLVLPAAISREEEPVNLQTANRDLAPTPPRAKPSRPLHLQLVRETLRKEAVTADASADVLADWWPVALAVASIVAPRNNARAPATVTATFQHELDWTDISFTAIKSRCLGMMLNVTPIWLGWSGGAASLIHDRPTQPRRAVWMFRLWPFSAVHLKEDVLPLQAHKFSTGGANFD